ncbi:MAG: YibE/F family protein, partial [Mycobacterium sp.]|nr:YibE/F family protein [Mycobacterium sp.]
MSHSHSHSHSPGGGPAPLGPVAARVVFAALAVIGLAAVIGAILLWPSGTKAEIPLPFQNGAGGSVTT